MKFKIKKSIVAAALSAIAAANSFSVTALAEQPTKKLFCGYSTIAPTYPNGETPRGSVEISNYHPVAGEEIIVTVTPNAGCKISSFSLYYSNPGNSQSFFHDSDIIGTYEKRFTMPSVNVQVGVRFDFINPPTSEPDPTPTPDPNPTPDPTPDPTPNPDPTPTPTPTTTNLKGDVNLDGNVDVRDATLVLKHIAELIFLTGQEGINADVNNDGYINAKDATEILKIVAGIA